MNLRVPNLMMAAVGAVGLYAVYRLVTNKVNEVGPEGGDSNLALLGDPLKLAQGRYYRGRLRVRDVGAPPFLSTADRATLENTFRLLGFDSVQVFMSEDELPANWPTSTTRNAGPLTRWFQAKWKLPSTTLPRPPDVEAMWIASPPGAAVSGLSPFFPDMMLTTEEAEEPFG